MPRTRITWKGSSAETHPELGPLIPGETIEVDLDEARLEGLRSDTTGLFVIDAPAPSPAPVIPAGSSQEDVSHG